jgi:Protein of unknown function (DUF732)
MDRDGQFLWRLSTQGLRLRRSKDAAINDARRICARYAGGESEQQIIQDMLAGSPGMSLDTAAGFADTRSACTARAAISTTRDRCVRY